MNAQRRHRNSSKYVNTSLREIQEEDISREDDRDDLRNARRGRAPKLPNIFDPQKDEGLQTKKSQPFSWFKADADYNPREVYPDVPSNYYEPDYKPPESQQEKRTKSIPSSRTYTQSRAKSHTESNMIEQRPIYLQKNRRILQADKLQRNYARPQQAQAMKMLRNVRSSNRVRPVDPQRREHLRRIVKPLPRVSTFTDEDADDSSSVKSRQYMAEQPLTFGIFSPGEDNESYYNPITTEEQMRELYLSIPASTQDRKEETVREFCYRLYRNNPLFRKVEYVTCVEFVCHCHIYCLERGRTLYQLRSELMSSYIVLWGTIELYSEDQILQGSYENGATLCEEYLLTGNLKKIGQTARAGKKGAGVLEISHNSLMGVRQSLSKIFLKKDLIMMESIFRKNYFSKKSIRNSFNIRNGDN